MPKLIFHPENTCSREMRIEHENGIIKDIEVIGGCQGNLRGICILLKGMPVVEAIEKLDGIKCHGSRTGSTSCPDQIAQALKSIKDIY